MFAGNFAPRGWAFCNGQILSIAQNTALFSLLGTVYGGNGQTTFGLPNLQGRVPIHAGQSPGTSPYTLGQTSGTETVTLTANQMPMHSHAATLDPTAGTPLSASIPAAAVAATVQSPIDAVPAQSQQGGRTPFLVDSYAPASAATGHLAPGSVAGHGQITVGAAGGSQPFNVVQPYQVVNFIIALQGIFPSRN